MKKIFADLSIQVIIQTCRKAMKRRQTQDGEVTKLCQFWSPRTSVKTHARTTKSIQRTYRIRAGYFANAFRVVFRGHCSGFDPKLIQVSYVGFQDSFAEAASPLSALNGDNDNDHSSRRLPVHKALTCYEGQSTLVLAHSLFGEVLASCRKNLSRCFLCRLRDTWNEVGLNLLLEMVV